MYVVISWPSRYICKCICICVYMQINNIYIYVSNLVKTYELCFFCIHLKADGICHLLQTMQQGFSLSRCIWLKHYIMCIVCIRNSLCEGIIICFLSFLVENYFLLLDLLMFKAFYSRHIMNRYLADVSPCRIPATISEKFVSPSGEQAFYFHVFIEHHYDCNSFFGETIHYRYLLQLSSVYRVKCLEEIYK